jgi:hypothetical protein
MPTTSTEKLIRHQKRRGGILVPMIEDFMRHPVNVEDEMDAAFLFVLADKMMRREQTRENGTPVYSPSALASCLRQVFLSRHHGDLGIEKKRFPRMESSYYFLKGNFIHMQWQFVFHKMIRAGVEGIEPLNVDTVEPYWCEFPVMSKRKDHGGTVDVGVKIFGEPMFIDVKGVNVRVFGETTRGYAPADYVIQLADYMMLYNSRRETTERINRSILLSENKGGPDSKFPIALHETIVGVKQYRKEVRRRLEVLRAHEEEEIVPAPECTSTGTFQFGGCPFRGFCKEEIQSIEKARRKADGGASSYKVARPSKAARRKRRG